MYQEDLPATLKKEFVLESMNFILKNKKINTWLWILFANSIGNTKANGSVDIIKRISTVIIF